MDHLIKVLIVDDELAARQLLTALLSEFTDIEIVGQAVSVDDAVDLSKKLHPDLVFLDVEMPGKNGFEFINEIKLSGVKPSVIFVTAYDKYAINAFHHAAIHYILKPASPVELREAIDRFKSERNKEELFSKFEQLSKELFHTKLKLNSSKGFVFIDPADIVYCEAEGNYTIVHLKSGQKETISFQLGVFEQRINSEHFVRINRSCLINSHYLRAVNRKRKQASINFDNQEIMLPVSAECLKRISKYFP